MMIQMLQILIMKAIIFFFYNKIIKRILKEKT